MNLLRDIRNVVAPPRLGDLLLAHGWVTPDDLSEALTLQARAAAPGERIGDILVRRGRLSAGRLDAVLAEQTRMAAFAATLTALLAAAVPAPALAASDGVLGRSSTASAGITLVIPDRNAAAGVATPVSSRSSSPCLDGAVAAALGRTPGAGTRVRSDPAGCTTDARLSLKPGPSPAAGLVVLEPE
ncbi:hypothetical protein D3874_12920 [Oleomonas cavernae]|uniref:Type II secretion system protein GspE N-terminal domain-containing protein n=1 Tax=Oleomonas cavernae TaxID=2320859 RepID=A0A418WCR1_9PROT|nr:hypothetical protein [Oleomonas cavernae]RJF87815.1 hypothetical protein D3874_12920 [Oleomonas cavernae]